MSKFIDLNDTQVNMRRGHNVYDLYPDWSTHWNSFNWRDTEQSRRSSSIICHRSRYLDSIPNSFIYKCFVDVVSDRVSRNIHENPSCLKSCLHVLNKII